MTTKLSMSDNKWHKLNTEYALLITGGPYRFFMNGTEVPDSKSAWHMLTGPQVVPQGVAAYIKAYEANKEVVISAFVPAGSAPVDPLSA